MTDDIQGEDKMIIYMVEDDEGHASLIQKNLRRAGVGNEIRHFTNGREAIDCFLGPNPTCAAHEEGKEALILLDLNLPEVDGYEVLRRLKSNEATQMIPVIVLTTTDNPKEIERCYELGCNVYITKPVDYDNFADAIRKLGLMLAIVKLPTTAAA